MKEVKSHSFNITTLISLFDIFVSPVLNYCSELWRYVKAQDTERENTVFLKRLLGLKQSTSNDMVYCESGRLPLIVQRQFNMLKYWLKLQKSDNCVLKGLYKTYFALNLIIRFQIGCLKCVKSWLVLAWMMSGNNKRLKMKKCSFLSPKKVLKGWTFLPSLVATI